MTNNLTEFSLGVKNQFFKCFPSLLNLQYQIIENDEKAFFIKINSPSPNAEHPLSIDTFGGEVTVAFDAYHAHFDEFLSEYESAVEFINQIIEGEYAVVSYWRDDRWCGSALLNQENFPKNNESYPYANKIKIRSWLGNLDHDLECMPRD